MYIFKRVAGLLSLALLVSVMLTTPNPTSAASTFVVDVDGFAASADCDAADAADSLTIQGGINAASVGDTVLVCPGTYFENVVVDKADLGRLDQLESQPAARPVYPVGLTQREVEVLLLIAKGKTTREIADELVLSARTVQRHISNLYIKINVRNRGEATAFALNEPSIIPQPFHST